jgi:hypothetical protein
MLSTGIPVPSQDDDLPQKDSHPILLREGANWRVRESAKIDLAVLNTADYGIFFLDLYNVLASLGEKLREKAKP